MNHNIHTIDTLNDILSARGLSDFLVVTSIEGDAVKVRDRQHGEYTTVLKAFCPKGIIPLHRLRARSVKQAKAAKKVVGTQVGEALILSLFAAADRGYKGRGFLVEYRGECGHTGITSLALLKKWKAHTRCKTCVSTTHGERGIEDGVRKKRTGTYTHWQRVYKTLPSEFHEFAVFKAAAGDKPRGQASITIVDGRPVWVCRQVDVEDVEVSLMATALRSAFRHSNLYRDALEKARLETPEGVRYRCAACSGLYRRKEVQVDHVVPVQDVEGNRLTKETLIDRIWTDKIQILDRRCHANKSATENKYRKQKKELKDGKREHAKDPAPSAKKRR